MNATRVSLTYLNLNETGSFATQILLGTVVYLILVRFLRYRRINSVLRDYFATHTLEDGKDATDPSAYPMTPAEAQQIMRVSSAYDAPWLVEKCLQFALFKTYGIESISKILLKTGQLGKEANASRRFVDTELLIQTWVNVPLTGPGSGRSESTAGADPRGAIAIARTNWLHSKYQISNDDYLYTLSLFIIEPGAWMEKYEWRGLTTLERQAYFVFWSEIGRRMGIHNIPETLQDLVEWCEEHERVYMLPSPINQTVAGHTTSLLLHHIPPFAKSIGIQAIAALCPQRLREATMQPAPAPWVDGVLSVALGLRQAVMRHCLLPRFKALEFVPIDTSGFTGGQVCPVGVSVCPLSSEPGKKAEVEYRLHPSYFENDPWYMPEPTTLQKLNTRILSALGLYNPKAIPSPRFCPRGFRTEELGPTSFEKSGKKEVLANAEAIYGGKITGPWAFSPEPKK